jgi:hypothetical protein
MGRRIDPQGERPSSRVGATGYLRVRGGTGSQALELEELLDWLDDRMAATNNAGTLLILHGLRDALSQLKASKEAIAQLLGALRPLPTETEQLGREDRWVLDSRRASSAIARARRLLEEAGSSP